MVRQRSLTPECPDTPGLQGKRAFVTGGNAGIGYWIAEGLARRGAAVTIAARREALLRDASARIGKATGNRVDVLKLDLADLSEISKAARGLARTADESRFDIVVLNAGVWPKRHATSPQGHEIAFAVNVLGHHALLKRMREQDLIDPGARVVILTGDIYIMARDCTPDFRYGGAYGGMLAYCRSKLGSMWLSRELAKHHPSLDVVVVHPGVVASGLVSGESCMLSGLNRRLLLSTRMGAQTPLIAATQPGLGRSIYLHNVAGRMYLSPEDPASNEPAAARFWDLLESLDSLSPPPGRTWS